MHVYKPVDPNFIALFVAPQRQCPQDNNNVFSPPHPETGHELDRWGAEVKFTINDGCLRIRLILSAL